jgi:hypothetical protein
MFAAMARRADFDEDAPLVRAMATLGRQVVRTVRVRSPVLVDEPAPHVPGQLHELTGRTGILLRAPFMLLRKTRRGSGGLLDEEATRRVRRA